MASSSRTKKEKEPEKLYEPDDESEDEMIDFSFLEGCLADPRLKEEGISVRRMTQNTQL